MIRLCEEKDRGWLLSYLQKDPVYHTFLLADMKQYGFNQPFQQIYVQEENQKCLGVYLRYYRNLILAGELDYIDGRAVAQLINEEINTVMGRGELVKQVSDYLGDKWKRVESHLYVQSEAVWEMEKQPGSIRIANLDDVDNIYQFLMSFPEFAAPYGEKAMITNRIANKEGIHMLIEKNGKIIAHGNSAAAAEKTCMIGGICVDPIYRGKGYAQTILSALGAYIHQQGKIPCIFAPVDPGYSIFEKMGFKIYGTWAVTNCVE